jgi:hypothetical protein
MATLLHELWQEDEEQETFCLAGPMGDGARAAMPADAKLIWTVWAESHFDAMTRYWQFKGWGEYTTDQESDCQPYPEEWLDIQQSR